MGAAEPGGGPLVATKLHIPEPPADRVSRPSLVAELRDGFRARLILVSAPGGAGKTTVLASSRADPAEHRPFGWAKAEDAGDPEAASAVDGFDELSERELAVLRLLSSRLSLREIGNELYVSLNTIKTHTRNVYAKLRVGSRQQAVIRARELGLLGRPRAVRH